MIGRKLSSLKDIIKGYGSTLVAFSGGVDSTLLLKVCSQVLEPEQLLAVTIKSSVIPDREIAEAEDLAKSLGVNHEVIEFDELSVTQLASNQADRCYYCKKALFSMLVNMCKEAGLNQVLDGSNLDDMGDYRPGMKAIRELAIKSPLKEAKLTKSEIRHLSQKMGLPTWNKPAMACLASRIPYGERITKDKLKRVEQSEDILRALGFTQFRVRSHGDLARIELSPQEIDLMVKEDMRHQVVSGLERAGFKYISLDLYGYRSGSMNEVLGEGEILSWKT